MEQSDHRNLSETALLRPRLSVCIPLLLSLSFSTLFLPCFLISGDHGKIPSRLQKGAVWDGRIIDFYNFQCVIGNYGYGPAPHWPKGSEYYVGTAANMWITGVHRPTNSLRIAHGNEYLPGPILRTFNTSTNSNISGIDVGDPDDARYHLYHVQKKDSLGGNNDYNNWPADLGAPYIDRNANGQWDKGVDRPNLWGDQQIWCVYNDTYQAVRKYYASTNPMGIEIQSTFFGFNREGALGSTLFIRWKIINKSDADYDSVFLSLYSDIDLGEALDNFAGVDVGRSLSYFYSATDNDRVYGKRSPAVGIVLLQGPRIPSPDSSTFFEGKRIAGYYSKPITSHIVFFNVSNPQFNQFSDPALGTGFPDQAYGFQKGFVSNTGRQFIDTVTGAPTKFVMSGDPVTGTGWTMDKTLPGGADVRSLLSTGPFTLAHGDTQEIVGAFIIAQGADRLNSIVVLRSYTDIVRDAFMNNFAPPAIPPSPYVDVASLSHKIVLNWDNSITGNTMEDYVIKRGGEDFRFEGYNIYQLREPVSNTTNYKRVATFDIAGDNIKTEADWTRDPQTGLLIQFPACFGNDTGLKRYIVIDRDYLNGTPLADGKEYYFAVTAYWYNFDSSGTYSEIPKVLETSKVPITVIPHEEAAGTLLGSSPNQTLNTNRSVNGDDAVTATVIEPSQVTGGLYSLTFNGVPGAITSWNLERTGVSPDTFLVRNATNFSGNDASPIIDGILFRVGSQTAGLRTDSQSPKGWSYTPKANRWMYGQSTGAAMSTMTDAEKGLTAGGMSYAGRRSANGYQVGSKVLPWECKKIEIHFTHDPAKQQYAYRFLDKVETFPQFTLADPSYLPYIKNRGDGILYQDFVKVPFTVWEVDSLDGSYAPRQLNVAFKERNDSLYDWRHRYVGLGNVDGSWMPTTAPDGGNEVLYIMASDYSPTPLPQYTTNPGSTTPMNLKNYQDSVDVMYLVWVKRQDTTATFEEGDILTLRPNYPLLPTTVFTIATPKNIVADKTMMKGELSRVNVFPNPYFAHNSAELSSHDRWVTFTNLPEQATIRIFSLSGALLMTIYHNDRTGFERWNLRNSSGLPVASGMYIAHIEIRDVGVRVLKIAVIQREEGTLR